jgi:hypothetical protein
MEGPKPTGPAPKPGKYLKISLYLKKKPEVTDEYFHAYWANNHIAPALLNKDFVSKVRRYNQVSPALLRKTPLVEYKPLISGQATYYTGVSRDGKGFRDTSAGIRWCRRGMGGQP